MQALASPPTWKAAPSRLKRRLAVSFSFSSSLFLSIAAAFLFFFFNSIPEAVTEKKAATWEERVCWGA